MSLSVAGILAHPATVRAESPLSASKERHSDVNAAVNIAGFAAPIGTARGAVTRPKFAHRVRPVAVESPSL